MTYNGRAVLAEVADKEGWLREECGPGPHIDGTDLAIYRRGDTRILILWTPSNTAVSIVKETTDAVVVSQTAPGPTGLITARRWIESAA